MARLSMGQPSFVRQLTVHNPTPYLVNVKVTGARRDGWLHLGSFRREQERNSEELIDQGRQWVFRFSYASVEAGELVVSRDELAREDWRITIPEAVAERLGEAGLSESAP